MGTEKRERQKANRQRRLVEEARVERTGKVRRNVIRWGSAAVLGIGVVVLIAAIGGAFSGDGDGDAAARDAGPVITVPLDITVPTTAPPVTYPDIPKPDIDLPAEEPVELVITDLVEGEGAAAQTGDTVLVYYVGVLTADGTEFDSNYGSGSPFPVTLGVTGVIQGWTDGLVGVRAGGQRQLDIPADLAYGDQGFGDAIPPGAAISFVVDVLEVTPGAESG